MPNKKEETSKAGRKQSFEEIKSQQKTSPDRNQKQEQADKKGFLKSAINFMTGGILATKQAQKPEEQNEKVVKQQVGGVTII